MKAKIIRIEYDEERFRYTVTPPTADYPKKKFSVETFAVDYAEEVQELYAEEMGITVEIEEF